MNFQHINWKAPRSRTEQQWTVYPHSKGDNKIIIQSDNKIACIWLDENKIQVSKSSSSGYTNIGMLRGVKSIDLPVTVLEQFKALTPTGKTVLLVG